jgi:hypothetical protein
MEIFGYLINCGLLKPSAKFEQNSMENWCLKKVNIQDDKKEIVQRLILKCNQTPCNVSNFT